MFGRNRNQKPPLGTPVNTEHPLWCYADLYLPFLEGTGPTPLEYVREVPVTPVSGSGKPTWAPGAVGGAAPSLSSSVWWSVPGAGQYTTQDFTLSWWLNQNNPLLWQDYGLFYTGAYQSNGFIVQPGDVNHTSIRATINYASGNATRVLSTNNLMPGTWQHWALVRQGGTLYLYLNGALNASNATGSSYYTSPAATTNPLLINTGGVPYESDGTFTLDNVLFLKGLALSSTQVADLYCRPWQLFQARPSMVAVPAIAPELTVSGPLYANGAQQALSLLGFDRQWTPDSTATFSITGSSPAGVSIASQSVADAAHATVTFNSGSASGSFKITDGTAAATVQVLPVSLAASPTTIPADHPGHITLTLQGNGTLWASGTTAFSLVSPPTGTAIVSQSIASATSATLILATASGAGTLTISDGTHQVAVVIAAPALTATATVPMVATGVYALTLSNPSAVWTQETASTLFAASGIPGASISNVRVISDTLASATLSLGNQRVAGAVAIVDTSTGATSAPFAVAALPSGSLHVTGQGLLSHTGGAPGLFGGKTAATLAFRFQANSNPATPYSPATVIGWGTSYNNAALATWYPQTQQLVIAVYSVPVAGNSNNPYSLSATIPIQFGVGYHFLISWGTTPKLYVNGVPYATASFSGVATYGYQQIQFGGNAGTGGLLDYAVSDVCVWSNYAATASDALALANNMETPLQVGSASIWWPLAGGNAGVVPSLSDQWLVDYTGNGNTLSLASGSLSDLAYSTAIALSSPVLRSAYVSKCGKLAIFGATAATPATNGGYQIAPITGVQGTPTVYRNGTPVQIGPPTWFSQTLDSPFVAYLLECGSVQAIAIQSGGSNYSSPMASASGGGGSGLVLGTPELATGITGYKIVKGGGGFAEPPTVTISDPTGTGAAAYAVTGSDVNSSGIVTQIVMTAGGSGYTNPTVHISAPAYGNDNAQAIAAVSGGVITGISLTNGGSSYNAPPSLSMMATQAVTSGPNASIAAQATPIIYGADAGALAGQIRAVIPTVGGLLGCGSGYSASAPPTISIATGSGCQLAVNLGTGGAISSIGFPPGNWGAYFGNNYPATVQLNIWDPTGTGAAATATVSGGQITGVTVTSPGSGYTNPVITIAPAGSNVTIQPIISAYIVYIPVTAGGSNYTSPPTIAISDPTGSGASVVPIMSGVLAGDVMTYNAPAAWITPTINGLPLGGLQAVVDQSMNNWTGQREGASGGLAAFAQAPTMLAGTNMGAQSITAWTNTSPLRNKIYCGTGNWGVTGSPTLTMGSNGYPSSWTNPSGGYVGCWIHGAIDGNGIDSMGSNSEYGKWTLRYDDPNVNTSAAMAVWLSGAGVVSQVSLSGPYAGQAQGVVVSAQDIKFNYGGGITAVGLAHTTAGSAYQGAIVIVSGGGGRNAVITANVSGGVITGFNILCPGTNYTSTPTITIYGTSVSGTTVTAITDFEYPAVPTSWAVNVGISLAAPAGTDGNGHWTIGNLWLVPPDATTRQPMTINPAMPFAPDINLVNAVTTPTGRVPAAMRFMDVTQGFGGDSNFIYPSDLIDPTSSNWSVQHQYVTNFQHCRYFNTDPNNSNYAWSSTKIYGPQAPFVLQDPSFTITGTLTAGSNTVTGISGSALMAGSQVFGPGIPAGTRIAGLSSGGAATLSHAATASGVQTLTITNPGYLPLAPSDAGQFLNSSDNVGVVELRSTTPHGLTTGQYIEFWANSPVVPVPFTNFGDYTMSNFKVEVWVTGPYTIAIDLWLGGLLPGAPYQTRAQTVSVTTEIDLTNGGEGTGWNAMLTWPVSGSTGATNCMPYEAAAAIVSKFPGCAYWVNIPGSSTDELVKAIAQKVIANIGPYNPIYLEYGNELWTDPSLKADFLNNISNLAAYLPAGTPFFEGYTANGQAIPFTIYGTGTLLSAHFYDVFTAAWTAAGLDPTRIHRVHGCFWAYAWWTAGAMEIAASVGARIDHVAVAPYHDVPGDLPILTAFSPAGSIIGGAASWPIDAINDLVRHWMAYSNGNQSLWQAHNQACQLYGQPVRAAGSTLANATATANLTPTTIASIRVGSGGKNYSSSPTVTLQGGGMPDTTATATVSGGVITAITPPSGSGWKSTPSVVITDPPGSGATATATASGSTVTVSVTTGGSGYKNPQVALSGGGGTYTSATATLGTGGVITAITVSGAAAYTGNPTISITDLTGSGASATAHLTPTSVASITMTSGGQGYVTTPSVSISNVDGNGSSASGSATVSGGAVTGVTLIGGGSGYTSPPNVTISGGGVLPAGNYYVCYTFVDAQGRETTIGESRTSITNVPANGLPLLGMVSLPSWAASMNLYLTSGQPGSETFYTSITRAQYNATGPWFPLNVPIPGSTQRPPTTNLAAPNIGTIPTVVTYEGSAQMPIPANTPQLARLEHDTFAHPSCRDLIWGWYAACQLGCQWMAGGGASLANYFQLYSTDDYPNMWVLAYGTNQVAGAGTNNQCATIQGGYPADGHDHNGGPSANVSTALQGFLDWVDASSPLPPRLTTTISPKGRWFSALGQSSARVARPSARLAR